VKGVDQIRLLIGLVLVDALLLSFWIGTSSAENCENDRLACNEFLAAVVPFAFLAGLLALLAVAVTGIAKLVRGISSRGSAPPDRYQCRKCGWRAKTEEAAMEHAEREHGAMSYREMRDTWTEI
jgi:hypothetical protein